MARQAQAEQETREEPEFIERLVAVNRVAKVVKGGRRFGFAAIMVIGDGKGQVGFGTGKAKEVPDAIRKATEDARRNMLRVPLREGRTIHHDITGRFGAGKVTLRSAPSGTGIIGGGPMRAIFEALGIQDIVSKSNGTANPHNMVRATLEALKNIQSPRQIASRRGKKVGDIVSGREIMAGTVAASEE
jgi:small subunit ribosomal protein S5